MLIPMIEFLEPARLWWLLLVPLLIGLYALLLWRKRARRANSGFSNLERLLPKQAAWKRHIAVGAAVLSLAALNVAYAAPKDTVDVPRDRATLVVTIDVSRSMEATDVQPNRLDAVKVAAKEFLGMVPPRFNISLVAFAGTASIIVPPTIDRGMVGRAIENLALAPSTAIGEGIYSSLDAVALAPADPDHPNDPAPAAVVLLSDGYTNVGRSSTKAAQAAKAAHVPIYTIAYGTPGGYVNNGGQKVNVPVDPIELAGIAQDSGGKAFKAGSSTELQEVYKSIASSVGYTKADVDVTERYAGIALGFAGLASIALLSLAARWP